VIIVVGVLTALAAEQGVEWLHWQQKTQAAEGQIARELSASWMNARERVAVADCLERRLDQIEARLLQPGAQWTPLPPMVNQIGLKFVYLAPGRVFSNDVWRSLTADGTIGHLPQDRQIRLGRMYDNIADLDRWNLEQLQEIGELNVLGHPLVLDNQQRVAFVGVAEQARVKARTLAGVARQASQTIPQLVQVTAAAKAVVSTGSPEVKVCKSLGLL
jgi:hypothetical protein